MATTRLGHYEVERNLLPDLCMRCGEPATTHKSRNFAWCPPWVIVTIVAGLLPYVIVAMVLTKRMRVSVPLCDAHRGHWKTRTLSILLGFVAVLGLLGIVIAFSDKDFVGILIAVLLFGVLAWIVLIVILQTTAIRPMEITDRSITLGGVAKTFSDAVLDKRERREPEDDYYDRRARRRRDVDHDDHDRPPRRQRQPDERYSNRDLSPGQRPQRSRDEEQD
jgi:hypothetical protein